MIKRADDLTFMASSAAALRFDYAAMRRFSAKLRRLTLRRNATIISFSIRLRYA